MPIVEHTADFKLQHPQSRPAPVMEVTRMSAAPRPLPTSSSGSGSSEPRTARTNNNSGSSSSTTIITTTVPISYRWPHLSDVFRLFLQHNITEPDNHPSMGQSSDHGGSDVIKGITRQQQEHREATGSENFIGHFHQSIQ